MESYLCACGMLEKVPGCIKKHMCVYVCGVYTSVVCAHDVHVCVQRTHVRGCAHMYIIGMFVCGTHLWVCAHVCMFLCGAGVCCACMCGHAHVCITVCICSTGMVCAHVCGPVHVYITVCVYACVRCRCVCVGSACSGWGSVPRQALSWELNS